MTRKKQQRKPKAQEIAPRSSQKAAAVADDQAGVLDSGAAILRSVADPLVSDIITETTRRCRRSLLAVSLLAFIVTWGELFPREINAFGFTVEAVQRTNLLYVIAVATAYFTLTFMSYCFSDSRLRKLRLRLGQVEIREGASIFQDQLAVLRKKALSPGGSKSLLDSSVLKQMTYLSGDTELVKDMHKAAAIRQMVDVYIPIVVGLGAIAVVVQDAGGLPGPQVLIALSSIVLILIVVAVLQSEKYRNFRRLLPTRRTTNDIKRYLNLVKKAAAVSKDSWRFKLLQWRMKRTKFGASLGGKSTAGKAKIEHNESTEDNQAP